MATGGAIRAGRAFVELFADRTQLVRGLKVAQQQFGAFRVFVNRMSFGIAGETSRMLAAAMPAGILGVLALFAKRFQDAGAEIHKVSQQTGMSAESLTSLGYAAEQAGASMGDVTGAVGNVQQSLLQAIQGNEDAIRTFLQLGLSVQQLARMNPEQQFLATAQALSRVTNGTLRATMANKLFGASGQALLPMIANGAKGIREMQLEAERLGLVMSSSDAAAASEQLSAWTRLMKTMGAVGTKVGAALAPMLTKLFNVLASGISTVVRWIDQNRQLVRIIGLVIAGVVSGAGAVIGFAVALGTAGAVLSAIAAGAGAVSSMIGMLFGVITAIVGSPLGLVLLGLAAGLAVLASWAIRSGAAMDWLRQTFGPLWETAKEVFAAIKNAIMADDWGAAANVLWTTLKLAWVQGTGYLLQLWYGFKHAAAGVMIDLSAALSKAWVATIDFFADAWSAFLASFRKSWIDASTWLGNRLIDLNPYMTAEEKEIEKADNNKIQAGVKGGIDRERDAAISSREAERRGKMNSITASQASMKEANDQQYNAQLASSEKALKDAREAWEKSIKDAKELGPQPGSPQLALPGIAAGMFNQSNAHQAGTFSSVAPRMFNSVDPMRRLGERILEETTNIRKNTDDLNKPNL